MANVFQKKQMSQLTCPQKETSYTKDNTPVIPVTHYQYLGFEIQSDLRWTTHIQNTTNKAQKTLNMLKRNLKQASTTVKSQAYKIIVRSQLEYASAIWDPHTAKYIRVQR